MKLPIIVDKVFNQPAAGVGGWSYVSLMPGYRHHVANWQVLLPAGKTPFQVLGNQRLTIGSSQVDLLASDYDRLRVTSGAGQGVIVDGPGTIADVPHTFSQGDRTAPGIVESTALDFPAGFGDGQIEIQSLALAAVPALGMQMIVEPLSEIPRREWNVDWDARDNAGDPTAAARPTNLRIEKIRSTPIGNQGAATWYVENFQAFGKDRLDTLMITTPDGGANAAVLNEIRMEIEGWPQPIRMTKLANDRALRRLGLNPGEDFILMPTMFDRNRDAWNLTGRKVKFWMYFTDALGGPDAAGVNKLSPVGGVRWVTVHRGGLD